MSDHQLNRHNGSGTPSGSGAGPVSASPAENAPCSGLAVRFWVSLALSVPVIGLMLVVPQLGGHVYVPATQRWGVLAQLVLATPVVLWSGWRYLARGWAGARSGSPDRFTLLGGLIAVSYAYSAVAALLPGVFPHEWRDAHGLVTVYFAATVTVVTLALLGELLARRA